MGGGAEVRPASHQVKAGYTLDYGLQNVLFFQIVGNSFIEDQFLSLEIYESILMVLYFFSTSQLFYSKLTWFFLTGHSLVSSGLADR